MKSLFEPVQLGSLTLPNRVFMAPLTRNRADADGVHRELAVTYYAQRASAGLIITEATQISPMGKGYINTPGIHSPQQVQAWRRVVDAVHRKGGRIFLQLWHVGRISHSSLLPNNAQPVAPSAIRANSQTLIATGLAPVSEPVALTASGIQETLADFRRGANPLETFSFTVARLNGYGLGYLHIVETAQNSKGSSEEDLALSAHLRTLCKSLYVVNGGYDGLRGEEALRTGHADAVAYGRAFLANPDLPRRLQLGAALNEQDPTTFYGGDAAGYTSYPALS